MSASRIIDIKNSSSFPKLRFKEFESKFIKKTLNEISNIKTGKGLSRATIESNGVNKCIFYGDLFTIYNPINPIIKTTTNERGKTFSTENNLLFPSVYSNSNNFFKPISLNEKNILIGNFITLFEINKIFSSDYISLYFWNFNNAKTVYKILEGSLAQQLHPKYLKNIEIKISNNLLEQNKIASFFKKIFEKITQENKLKNKWELLLNSISEKTFEKNKDIKKYYVINDKLEEFFSFFSGLVSNTVNENEKHKNNLLPYAIVREKITCDSKDLVPFNGKGNPQSVLNKNDVLFISYSGSKKNVGICSIYTSDIKAFLSSCCFGMRLKEKYNDTIDPKFINAIFNWVEYKNKIKSLIKGSVVHSITTSLFKSIKVKIPNYKTQISISNIFYSIVKIIEIQTKLIEKIETFKKYFLDSMF